MPALDYWWPCSDKATPSLPSCPSLPLFFLPLNLSLPSTPTPLSYLRSTSRPLIAAKGSGECLSFPVGPGGVRPPNVFWRILSVNLSLFECLTMKHLLCLKNGGPLKLASLFHRTPRTCLTPACETKTLNCQDQNIQKASRDRDVLAETTFPLISVDVHYLLITKMNTGRLNGNIVS